VRNVVALVAVVVVGCSGTPKPSPPPPPAGPDARLGPFTATVSEVGAFVGGSHGLAIAPDGTLFASDTFGAAPAIYAFVPPYTAARTAVAVPATQPAGLLATADALIVCDLKADEVRRHPRDAAAPGGFAAAATTWHIPHPWNVAALPDGSMVVVTYDNAIARLEPEGGASSIAATLDAPFDVVAAPDGTVWVSEQVADPAKPGRVRRWTLDGVVADEIVYDWKNPEGMALDARGYLWVADTERGELVRVAPDGTAEMIAKAELPILVRALPSGDLVVNANKPAPHLIRIDLR
jgi:sugar lactone lactonase YvrE